MTDSTTRRTNLVAQLFAREEATVDRYNALFDIPLGGKEWQTMEAEDVFTFFQSALPTVVNVMQRKRDKAIADHKHSGLWARLLLWLEGWEPLHAPSLKEEVAKTRERCLALADWAESNQFKNFYRDIAVRNHIDKPRKVAELLDAWNVPER